MSHALLKLRLYPSEGQRGQLLQTMEAFSAAATWIGQQAFEGEARSQNKHAMQRAVYRKVRERFRLSAQMTTRAISVAIEKLKGDRTQAPVFPTHVGLLYDRRVWSVKRFDLVSILTIGGRVRVLCAFEEYIPTEQVLMEGHAVLRQTDGQIYLYVAVEVPEEVLARGPSLEEFVGQGAEAPVEEPIREAGPDADP